MGMHSAPNCTIMISYQEFSDNAKRVCERLQNACAVCGRKAEEVSILPVTKFHPADAVLYASKYGFSSVGENRVQEAEQKMPLCPAGIKWELIGHLQSNKAASVVEHGFYRVQSADSAKILKKLNDALENRRPNADNLHVLLQINAGADPAKFGADLSGASALMEYALSSCPRLAVDGLMTIAPLDENLDVAERCFENLRRCAEALRTDFGLPLPELSMGMSADMERAVRQGATIIRIGTALFGEREKH